MKYKKCGSENCQIINEVHTTGSDFSASQGCCVYILFGPLVILCGVCCQEEQTHNTQYWIYNNCGNK